MDGVYLNKILILLLDQACEHTIANGKKKVSVSDLKFVINEELSKSPKFEKAFGKLADFLESLFDDIYEKLDDVKSDTELIYDLKKENIKTRESIEQELKNIIENQNSSDLLNYLINEKTSVKNIMKRVAKNMEKMSEEEIISYFKSLEKALKKFESLNKMFDPTRGEKIRKAIAKVVGLFSGRIGELGVKKLLEKIVNCFED